MIYFLRDHKTGFKLGKAIANQYKIIFKKDIKLLTFFNEHKDFIENNNKDKFVIFIRNPKEIIISGWKYHQVCDEPWCVQKDFDYYSNYNLKNISKDHIDFSKTFSKDKSYQNKIKNMSEQEGILFEMNNVGRLTLLGLSNILDIKKENVLFIDVDEYTHKWVITVRKLLNFMFYKRNNLVKHFKNVLKVKTNVKFKKDDRLHITNRFFEKNRYKKYWSNKLDKEIDTIFPGLMDKYKEKIK